MNLKLFCTRNVRNYEEFRLATTEGHELKFVFIRFLSGNSYFEIFKQHDNCSYLT